ncbi:MAG: ECF transporter S component [Erysipelotrichaceae bacterium]|nr:ECF transporter S component [Erysipelotrichaceae bacterium]
MLSFFAKCCYSVKYYAIVIDVETAIRKNNIKVITSTGILLALEIVFQIIGNYVSLGPVSINLSLIPIAVGAILYGPLVGGFLGLCNGILVILAPATLSLFMSISVWGTLLTCLLKCTIAGIVAGLVFKLFKNHKIVGGVVASFLVPIVNTGLFCLSCSTIFRSFLTENYSAAGYDNAFLFLILGVVGWNFLLEMGITGVLSYPVSRALFKFQNNVYREQD